MKDLFENVSWDGLKFTDLVNMIIEFIWAIVKGEFPEVGEIVE